MAGKSKAKGEITHEQHEAAILLRAIWDKRKTEWGFTQADAEKATGISQPSISSYLSGRYGMGHKMVLRFAKFLQVPPSTIMPSLSYLDTQAAELAALDEAGKNVGFAPLFNKEQAEQWLIGELSYRNIPASTKRIPILDDWKGRRCFAMLASQQDAAANKSITLNDILICDPTRRPGAGEMAIYSIDDEWALGTLQRHAKRWMLTCEPFDPIPIENEDEQRVSAVLAVMRLSGPALMDAQITA